MKLQTKVQTIVLAQMNSIQPACNKLEHYAWPEKTDIPQTTVSFEDQTAVCGKSVSHKSQFHTQQM